MGAIAGIIYPNLFPVSYSVHPMLEAMEARSPEEARILQYRNIELGARNEEVYFSPRAQVWIALDGILYNLKELHTELLERGYKLAHHAEPMHILAEAYHCWGDRFIERLNGPFAIALFDRREHSLLLARSRIGRKPLFWTQQSGYFLFGSELKSLIASGIVPQAPDMEALAPYLFFGYLPQDYSLVRGINRLLPGTILRYSSDGSVSTRSYWHYGEMLLQKNPTSLSTVSKEVEGHLLRILTERSTPRQTVGYFSRGGVGAAALGCCLHRIGIERSKALCITLAGEDEGPLRRAQEIAQGSGSTFESMRIEPDDLCNDLVRMVWHLDDPIGDPEAAITWQMFNLAKERADLVFSPAGCNEILAGYPRYRVTERSMTLRQHFTQMPKWMLRKIVLPLLRRTHQASAFAILREMQVDPWQVEYLVRNAVIPGDLISSIAPRRPANFDPALFLQRFPEIGELGSTVTAFLFLDGKTVLPDRLIPQYDRFAPAMGIQCVTPFLDRYLIEYLSHVPEECKISAHETALPLNELVSSYLPTLHFHEPRSRFVLPPSWIDRPEIRRIFELLAKGSLVDSGWISGEWIRQSLRKRTLTPALFTQLWALLVLEVWFRLFIFEPISFSPPNIPLLDFLKS